MNDMITIRAEELYSHRRAHFSPDTNNNMHCVTREQVEENVYGREKNAQEEEEIRKRRMRRMVGEMVGQAREVMEFARGNRKA